VTAPAPEVLTVDEAAALLRVSPDVVYRLALAGELPARRVGAQWRLLRSEVFEWLASPPSPAASAASSTSSTAAAGGGRRSPAADALDNYLAKFRRDEANRSYLLGVSL
jgi:excisionase family DNA binding protein